MSSFLRRILTGTLLTVGVAAVLLVDPLLPPGLMPWSIASVLCALGVWELGRMGTLRPLRLGRSLGGSAAVVILVSFPLSLGLLERPSWLTSSRALGIFYVLAAVLALGIDWAATRKEAGAGAGAEGAKLTVLLALWLVPPMFGLAFLQAGWGTTGLFVLVLLAKIGDVFGYFVGRQIGKRHPFPRLSPGKTVAGCVASLVAGTAAGIVVAATGLLVPGALGPVLAGAVIGFAINVVSQAGDLAESWVKRHAGVKDSSHLVGASGGVLDVVDSLLLATPTALLAFPVLFVP